MASRGWGGYYGNMPFVPYNPKPIKDTGDPNLAYVRDAAKARQLEAEAQAARAERRARGDPSDTPDGDSSEGELGYVLGRGDDYLAELKAKQEEEEGRRAARIAQQQQQAQASTSNSRLDPFGGTRKDQYPASHLYFADQRRPRPLLQRIGPANPLGAPPPMGQRSMQAYRPKSSSPSRLVNRRRSSSPSSSSDRSRRRSATGPNTPSSGSRTPSVRFSDISTDDDEEEWESEVEIGSANPRELDLRFQSIMGRRTSHQEDDEGWTRIGFNEGVTDVKTERTRPSNWVGPLGEEHQDDRWWRSEVAQRLAKKLGFPPGKQYKLAKWPKKYQLFKDENKKVRLLAGKLAFTNMEDVVKHLHWLVESGKAGKSPRCSCAPCTASKPDTVKSIKKESKRERARAFEKQQRDPKVKKSRRTSKSRTAREVQERMRPRSVQPGRREKDDGATSSGWMLNAASKRASSAESDQEDEDDGAYLEVEHRRKRRRIVESPDEDEQVDSSAAAEECSERSAAEQNSAGEEDVVVGRARQERSASVRRRAKGKAKELDLEDNDEELKPKRKDRSKHRTAKRSGKRSAALTDEEEASAAESSAVESEAEVEQPRKRKARRARRTGSGAGTGSGEDLEELVSATDTDTGTDRRRTRSQSRLLYSSDSATSDFDSAADLTDIASSSESDFDAANKSSLRASRWNQAQQPRQPPFSGSFSSPLRLRDLANVEEYRVGELVWVDILDGQMEREEVVRWWPAVVRERTIATVIRSLAGLSLEDQEEEEGGRQAARFDVSQSFKYSVQLLTTLEAIVGLPRSSLAPWPLVGRRHLDAVSQHFDGPDKIAFEKLVLGRGRSEGRRRPDRKELSPLELYTLAEVGWMTGSALEATLAHMAPYRPDKNHEQDYLTPLSGLSRELHEELNFEQDSLHFQGLAYGAEILYEGDLVRLLSSPASFESAFGAALHKGADNRAVFMLIDGIFHPAAPHRSPNKTFVIGSIYELVTTAVANSLPPPPPRPPQLQEYQAPTLPPPPPGFVFRKLGDSFARARLHARAIAGRYRALPSSWTQADIERVLEPIPSKWEDHMERLGQELDEELVMCAMAGLLPGVYLNSTLAHPRATFFKDRECQLYGAERAAEAQIRIDLEVSDVEGAAAEARSSSPVLVEETDVEQEDG